MQQRPKLSELPFNPPQNIQVKYFGEARITLRALVHREVDDEMLAAATGVLDDSRLEVFQVGDRVMTLARHHWLQEEQQRYLYRTEKGELIVRNHLFKLHDYAPARIGLESFIRQVHGARTFGVKRLETFAAGDFNVKEEWIGYYVWPRFGFNAALHPLEQRTLPFPLRGAKTVNELLRRGGKDYWFQYGFGRDMLFDLDARSASIKTLILYWREKAHE